MGLISPKKIHTSKKNRNSTFSSEMLLTHLRWVVPVWYAADCRLCLNSCHSPAVWLSSESSSSWPSGSGTKPAPPGHSDPCLWLEPLSPASRKQKENHPGSRCRDTLRNMLGGFTNTHYIEILKRQIANYSDRFITINLKEPLMTVALAAYYQVNIILRNLQSRRNLLKVPTLPTWLLDDEFSCKLCLSTSRPSSFLCPILI